MLTRIMRDALTYIDDYINREGIGPTVRDIKRNLGLLSMKEVQRVLSDLESSGYTRRLPRKARAIEVVRRPGDVEYHVWDLGEHRLIPIDEARKKKEPSKKRAQSG